MAYVVTQACIGNKHTSCVDVCPVEAFREGEEMLVIDPQACIDCNACVSACPEQAIYSSSAVPKDQLHFIDLNAEKATIYPKITESIHSEKLANKEGDKAGQNGHFAVVGSGPSGFYSAEALLRQFPKARVDIFDRLPTPYGLVRYGVAPDHPKIKSVTAGFERIARSAQVRFFGNVHVGSDLSWQELQQYYHGVIYATGGSQSNKLNICGGDLDNVFGAADFVGWYNGHPHHQNLQPDLSHERAAVIGVGNVALDIARILILPHHELKKTDMANHALLALRDSAVTEVCLFARRGPMQAAFTPKELEQLMAIPNLDVLVNANDLVLTDQQKKQLELPENNEAKQNIALLTALAERQKNTNPNTKRIRFVFCGSPVKIEESDHSKTLLIERNALRESSGGKVHATSSGDTSQFSVGLIISATGYKGEPIAGLPFNNEKGVIENNEARIMTGSNEVKHYVAGWIKRGASGVIGSNKQCANDTVVQLTKDFRNQSFESMMDIVPLLRDRDVNYVDFDDWLLLDEYEKAQGKLDGRPRTKETDIARMLEIIQQQKRAKQQDSLKLQQQPLKAHYRSCTLCEAMCGIKIEYQDEKIISIAGDPEDQHSEGHICPKGYALQDLHNDPDRLKKPMQKIDGQWFELSWDEALDITAKKLADIQEKYGNDAVAGYWGNPTSHNLGLMLATGKFRKVLGSRNLFTAASLDQMPHQLTSYLMFGLANAFTIPDIDHTDYMLMLGANPAASNGSLMTSGDVLKRLESIKNRGGKWVLIDPRKNESALYASEHHFIRPGTDALFLVGMIQHVIANRLYKPGRLKDMVDHWDELLGVFGSFSMTKIAEQCGIAEQEIVRITEEFCSAERAICYGRMGVSTQIFGALNHWLINILNILTGNLDRRGGMMFTTPAMDVALKPNTAGSYGAYHTRVRGLPEFNREFPVSAMAEEILTPGEGQIKALICMAGNPALSTPNGGQLNQALEQLEFMVSVDFYLNETSCHADIILPPTGPLEHEQFDLVFNLLAVRNVARFSPPLFDHQQGELSDWDIMQGLTQRLAELKGIAQKGPEATPVQVLDFALRNGPYGKGYDEYQGEETIHHEEGLTLKKLAEYEHGLDLGPLQPRFPEHLYTKGKRICLLPEPMLEDFKRLQRHFLLFQEKESLLLIGRRDLRTNNSWMHNSKRLIKGADRCALFMHPKDAEARGLAGGDRAKISSRVGCLLVSVKVTEDIMSGVVCLPHGWGHDREGIALQVAATNPGVNKNDLTDDQLVDSLSGNAVLNGVPVEVELLY